MGYLYSVYDVAEILKVHPETVRRWIRKDELKTLGGLILGKRYGYVMSTEQVSDFVISNPIYFRKYFRLWFDSIWKLSQEKCNDFDSTLPLFADKVASKEEPLWTTTTSSSQKDLSPSP